MQGFGLPRPCYPPCAGRVGARPWRKGASMRPRRGRPPLQPLPLAKARRALSRRPRRLRQPRRPQGLAEAVERLRLDHPMWSQEKLGPILRKQGYATSNATVGRSIGALIRRGKVQPVSALIRKVAATTAPKKRPHAIRKPKGVTFEKPGDVVQIDTLSIHLLPGLSIKPFNAYDPFAKRTVARPCKPATAKNAAEFLAAVLEQMPDPLKAIQIDGGSEFMAEFEQACADKNLPLYVRTPRSSCRPDRQSSTEPSSAATEPGAMSSTPRADLPIRIDKIAQRVDAFQSSTTPTDLAQPSPKYPSRVPRYPPSQQNPTVSYVLSQDTRLTCLSWGP
jgi:putative transposase